MNHKRGRPKHRRAGCLLCKPHKDEREPKVPRSPRAAAALSVDPLSTQEEAALQPGDLTDIEDELEFKGIMEPEATHRVRTAGGCLYELDLASRTARCQGGPWREFLSVRLPKVGESMWIRWSDDPFTEQTSPAVEVQFNGG